MNRDKWTLAGSTALGVGLGAGLMYLLDPQGGRRRRAVVRDKAIHALRKGGEACRKTSRDLGNRTRGLVAEATSKLRREGAKDLKNRVPEEADGVPALQGDGRSGRRLGTRDKLGAALGAVSLGLLAQSFLERRGHAP